MQDIYRDIMDRKDTGRPAVLVTVVALKGHVPTELQSKMLVGAEGQLAGTVGGGAIEKRALAAAGEVLEQKAPLLKEYFLDDQEHEGDAENTGMLCGGWVSLFYEYIGPATRAYVFGAGHIGRALQPYLAPLDFDVVLVDYRPEQLTGLDLPHLRAGEDYTTLPDLPGLAESYVVVATHSHACDERVLEQILASGVRPRYLGMVASRRKCRRMLANVSERVGKDVDLDWIHVPVGLHLGGNTPAAVALSIAAEIQAVRCGTTGHVHMRDRMAGSEED